jgi:uracil-DNA glycosylase
MKPAQIHPSWDPIFSPIQSQIDAVLASVADEDCAPPLHEVFTTFTQPLEAARVVIIGQDPYPTRGHAHGLSFSVKEEVNPLPKSLKNIFTEYQRDLGYPMPRTGNLSPWLEQGVILLNRIMTTRVGESNAHINRGWEEITTHICRELGARGCVALLWGNQAQEMQPLFEASISSPHPSPLSAYRGFFGSRPFSRVNGLLESRGLLPIDWKLP